MAQISNKTAIGRLGDGFTVTDGVISVNAGAGVSSDSIWGAAGDLVIGTGNDMATRLPIGLAYQLVRVNSGATSLEYATVTPGDTLPSQTGNDGKYLKTNGSTTSWANAPSSTMCVQRTIEGVVSETSLMYWVAPVSCEVASCNMYLFSSPTGSGTYCKVQVMKNGVLETNSIFSNDVPMQVSDVTVAVNGIFPSYGTLDGTISLTAGDVLHFRVNEAATGSADLLVQTKINFL